MVKNCSDKQKKKDYLFTLTQSSLKNREDATVIPVHY